MLKDCQGLHAYLNLSVGQRTTSSFERFEHFARREPAIVECSFVSGQAEYVLRIATASVADYRALLLRLYQYVPDIDRIDSKFVLESVKGPLVA